MSRGGEQGGNREGGAMMVKQVLFLHRKINVMRKNTKKNNMLVLKCV